MWSNGHSRLDLHEALTIFLTATDDTVTISEDMVITNCNQTGMLQLIQYLKQAFPFTSRQSADKPIDLLRGNMALKMNTAKLRIVLIARCLLTRFLVHRVAPLPSDSLVVQIYCSATAPLHDLKKKPLL